MTQLERAQIAAAYLQRLTMRQRALARSAHAQADGEAAYNAAMWAERAQELRQFILKEQEGQ